MEEVNNQADFKLGVFAENAWWIKFSDYFLTNNMEDELCIMPCSSSKIEKYKPIDYYPEIYKQFLKLSYKIGSYYKNSEGKEYNEKIINIICNDKEIINSILEFTNNFGLLGLLNLKIISMFKVSDKVYVLENESYPNKEGYIKTTEYENFIKPYIHCETIHIPLYPRLDDKSVYLAKLEYEEGLRYFGEPIKSYISRLLQFYYKIFPVLEVQQNNIPPESKFSSLEFSWKQIIENDLKVSNITIGITYLNKKWQIEYRFNSLFQFLIFMAVQNFSTNKPIILCENCKNPIEKRHPNQKVCGKIEETNEQPGIPRCGNAGRQAQYRKRKKNANKLLDEGYSYNEVAKMVGSDIKTVKKWASKK